MTITVKFVGAFRHFSGIGELDLDFADKNSVGDLMTALIKELPEIESSLIDQYAENSSSNALILVNGREIGVLAGVNTILKDGDEVVLVPVVHGG
jgi:MoaD family protein